MSGEPICKIDTEKNGIIIITLNIDSITSEENENLKKTFQDILDTNVKDVILDLSQTFFISSLVIASLVYIYKELKNRNGGLVLCGVKDRVKDVLEITNLDKVFTITDNRTTALQILSVKK